mmetsp:Transcript_23478/g.36173  ORF Transcript_23478/g.36173 Transcript_23478/m.36173 type:complete len:145 (-) Transcript_23478:13-447(-)
MSYELEMDDGEGGDFVSLVGGDSSGGDSLATTWTTSSNISEGVLYRFRYRARNVNGWSDYSPITYLKAATVPARPSAPSLVSVDSTQVTITIVKTNDDGGSDITKYEIWKNAGTGSVVFTKLKETLPTSPTVSITVSASEITAG